MIETFVEKTTEEVYRIMNQLVREIEFVLSKSWTASNRITDYSEESLVRLEKDLSYLKKMKAMDEEIREESRMRREGEEEEREGGDGGGERKKKKLVMSDVVPVAGLVMARFHIYECECATVLDLWKNPPRNLSSFFSLFISFFFLI